MNTTRAQATLRRALDYISLLTSGLELYDTMHNYLHMTNAEITAEGFDLQEHYEEESPEFLQENATEPMPLRDLLYTPMEDVHLLHKDVEIEPATIVELSETTLTDAGKQAWADVLDAKVYRIYQGFYGLQVELDGVKPSRLQSFSTVLAGYCSVENYEKWVAQPEEAPAPSPEMKL